MNRSKLLLSTCAAMLLSGGAAYAQQSIEETSTDADLVADVIVVTAEPRTTKLETTPTAAMVLSGDDIEDRGVTSVDQLQFVTPSLTVQNRGQGNSFNIRGIGKTEPNVLVGVGVTTYRDNVATSPGYFQNEPYYDIGGVEVLRGPQGTFAGENATGGAVYITETLPDFEGVSGYLMGQLGNYNQRAAEGAVTLPMSETLSARVAFRSEYRDSFHDVSGPYTGNPGELQSNAARVGILWTPTEALRVLFRANYSDVDAGGYPADPVTATNNLFEITSNAPWRARDTAGRAVLNVSYELGNGVTLRSLSGYFRGTTRVSKDLDGTSAGNATFRDRVKETLWSQEFDIISPDHGPLTWILGAYYSDDLARFPVGEFETFNGLYSSFLEGENPRTTSAAFGQIGYDLTDRLKVEVGLRYTHSTSTIDAVVRIPAFGRSASQNEKSSENVTTGKISLSYELDDNNFLYAFVARGHKPGGINSVNGVIVPRPFEGEDVTDYEIGWKSTAFDGHVHTQLGAYYNQYAGFQVGIGDPFAPTVSSILNVDDDTIISGIEASAQGSWGALDVSGGISVAHTELGTFYAADPRFPRTAVCDPKSGPALATCLDLSGNEQTYAPELTVQLGVAYEFDIGNNATLTPRVDYSHISKTWSTLFQRADLGDRLGGRDIVNAQIEYRRGGWSAVLYSTNLTDLEYVAATQGTLRYAGAPRQYGLKLMRSF